MKPIRNSAKAVIIEENRVLLTRNRDHKGEFYLFPGGGQEHGEELRKSVVRECIEEIGYSVTVRDLIHVREYIGKNHEFSEWDSDVHQVEFYFECELIDYSGVLTNGENPDANQLGVEWVEMDRLDQVRVYPKVLSEILRTRNNHANYLGDTN